MFQNIKDMFYYHSQSRKGRKFIDSLTFIHAFDAYAASLMIGSTPNSVIYSESVSREIRVDHNGFVFSMRMGKRLYPTHIRVKRDDKEASFSFEEDTRSAFWIFNELKPLMLEIDKKNRDYLNKLTADEHRDRALIMNSLSEKSDSKT